MTSKYASSSSSSPALGPNDDDGLVAANSTSPATAAAPGTSRVAEVVREVLAIELARRRLGEGLRVRQRRRRPRPGRRHTIIGITADQFLEDVVGERCAPQEYLDFLNFDMLRWSVYRNGDSGEPGLSVHDWHPGHGWEGGG